jgi:hypothetical protein
MRSIITHSHTNTHTHAHAHAHAHTHKHTHTHTHTQTHTHLMVSDGEELGQRSRACQAGVLFNYVFRCRARKHKQVHDACTREGSKFFLKAVGKRFW